MHARQLSDDVIRLSDAPELPGLVFRHFRGESDYPGMVEVLQGSKEADQIDEVDTIEALASSYAHLVNSDPFQDMVFAEVGDRTVGYNRVMWRQELDGKRLYIHFGFLLPEWRGHGIGGAMVRHSERRLIQIAAGHPSDGPKFLQTNAYDRAQAGLVALLERAGYVPERYFYDMLRPDLENIPEAPMPPGLEVRPVGPESYRAVWEAEVEAFRDHWGYIPPTEEDYQVWQEHPNFRPSLWKVGWDGDQVAGMVQNFIDDNENARHGRQRGYTEDICVRRPWRGRGLARSLIVQSLHMHKELGMTEAALGVDTENPNGALHLYESVGFRPVKRQVLYRKPLA